MFLSGSPGWILSSAIVFMIASLTDWYDGWYARKYGFATKWGRFLDPLADKILTSTAFICFLLLAGKEQSLFGEFRPVPLWLLVSAILFRDIVLTAIRSFAELKGKEFRTSFVSKAKTFVQMFYIFLFLVLYVILSFRISESTQNFARHFLFTEINYFALTFITLLTGASGIGYLFESKPGLKTSTA
jgi:CDP-diacylglycerol--glycerol-3-phosphate 3-phosphatidyltransferase